MHSYYYSTPQKPGQSKFRTLFGTGFTAGGPRNRPSGRLIGAAGLRIRPMNQFPIDLGAHGRFNDRIVNIAQNACFRAQLEPIAGFDVALDSAIEHDIGPDDRPFSAALLAHRHKGARVGLRPDVAVDVAVHMQAADEFDVAVDTRLGADQGVDFRVLTLFLFEHWHHPCAELRRPLRFRSTFPAPSKRRPAESYDSHLCL